MSSKPYVRAIDGGYGHFKWTDGRDERDHIRCDSFPSQSPLAPDGALGGSILQKRDTFLVNVNNRRYEVGHAVALAGTSQQESEVLDQEFALSDAYMARAYGALSYMLPSLKGGVIDHLVMGLPLNTISKFGGDVAKRFTGEHIVNASGARIAVKECTVWPQPLGAYMTFMAEHKKTFPMKSAPMALVVDPGYNTVDWFVCKGMSASESRSNAVLRGMSTVLRAIADKIIKNTKTDASTSELVRKLDEAMRTGAPFTMHGKEKDLTPFMDAGLGIVEEAAQAIKNSVGSGVDIDVIVIAGGGAKLYAGAIASKFPNHEVIALDHPSFANVRGFQLIGEKLAASASRAAGIA